MIAGGGGAVNGRAFALLTRTMARKRAFAVSPNTSTARSAIRQRSTASIGEAGLVLFGGAVIADELNDTNDALLRQRGRCHGRYLGWRRSDGAVAQGSAACPAHRNQLPARLEAFLANRVSSGVWRCR